MEINDGLFLRKLMWVPMADLEDDRHHHIYFKCDHCRPLKKACQFYKHYSDLCCEAPILNTLYDKPVCNNEDCPEQDFLKVTHKLTQAFCDGNFDRIFIFFDSVAQAEDFFVHFPAKECLESSYVWAKYSAIVQFHKSLVSSCTFLPIDIVISRKPGTERLYYVSGTLPSQIGL